MAGNPKELLACGLSLYFGSDKEKERLETQEYGLYDLIERIAVLRINSAALNK